MSMEDLENILTRAEKAAQTDGETEQKILRETLTLIGDEWPYRQDRDILTTYLVNDCRTLAKQLLAIADAAERWDSTEAQQARNNDTGGYGG